jgi:orotidine-5'-phosphate decarboxylase
MESETQPNFADDLLAAIEEKGSPVCVGLDPVWDRLPKEYQKDTPEEAQRVGPIGAFCREVIEIVAPFVPAVKLQSACFERYGPEGVDLFRQIVSAAQERDLVVIGDVKRSDIASTAQAYAEGHLRGLALRSGATPGVPDAITVSPYFGTDGLQPFVDLAAEEDRGVFILVRTSNPSAKEVQDIADASGKKVYEHVAAMVARLGDGEDLVGDRGYSCVGAVVGATYPDEARRLRELMPRQIFLVPGYGAQGASAADCAASFKNGEGAIVNASRSVIYAYQDKASAGMDWKKVVEAAARSFAEEIRKAVAVV